MSESQLQSLEKELTAIKAIISNAMQTIATNGTVKISEGLEKRIEKLCEKLMKLPPKNAKKLGEQLPLLVNSLDIIANDIKKVISNSEKNKKTSMKKASQAYQSTLLNKRII